MGELQRVGGGEVVAVGSAPAPAPAPAALSAHALARLPGNAAAASRPTAGSTASIRVVPDAALRRMISNRDANDAAVTQVVDRPIRTRIGAGTAFIKMNRRLQRNATSDLLPKCLNDLAPVVKTTEELARESLEPQTNGSFSDPASTLRSKEWRGARPLAGQCRLRSGFIPIEPACSSIILTVGNGRTVSHPRSARVRSMWSSRGSPTCDPER
jgi:hypothetical protein